MSGAELRETHVGIVMLIGDRAYKMKKPVRTGFLDFSTLELRREVLRRELELNRRLSPDVYLGISDVSAPRPDGAPADVAEHLLVMRRMPADRRLATLLTTGADLSGPLRELARLMARFHAGAARGPAVNAEGSQDALRERWRDNIAETRAIPGAPLDDTAIDVIERLSMRFIDGRGPLFAHRIADDRIVDGHGDLIADDVFFLDDGPRVLDCLEFDDRLRYVDALDDVAFLAMDLERLGAPDRAAEFLVAYTAFSGDPAPSALRHHYTAYRAFVRTKVACLRHGQGDSAAAQTALEYAEVARRHLERGAVRLALVGGLPGTGKTTIAGGLADRFGAVVLSSDRIRKELAGINPTARAGAAYREGLYSAEHTEALYRELLDRAGELLSRGESVILDASWTSALHRQEAEKLAKHTHSELIQLECRTSTETAVQRLRTRPVGSSDATAEIAAAMAAADEWSDAMIVDTSGPVEESLRHAAPAWQALSWPPRRHPRPHCPSRTNLW
ncbi:bifunctional aminoglycoside phosphotransferase/ATP-binding protein [Pseudonocardia asaccharolytica]|uniref:bifunctional aminoglycoside phosphotransferase/ATP-binding protein n=1 Tax=Pseudonocardia asaccharolytica TaxID=54010 RepID=UPI000415DA0E|nr:AAA family ATPase [Pseudonocardia asaccharolytica]